MSDLLTVARYDFRVARRSKLLWGVVAMYLFFGGALFYAGGTGSDPQVSQTLFVQVFVTALFLPLVAVAASYLSVAGERESETVTFLLSRPVRRRSVVLGKLLSRAGIMVLALAGMIGAGLVTILLMYPGLEPVAIATFAGLTLLLIGAYVSTTVAISTATGSRSRAIAGAVGFYFVSDVLFVFEGLSIPGLLRYVLEEFGGLSLGQHFYSFVASLSPAQAYINSTLLLFDPADFGTIPLSLPWYLQPPVMIAILLAWLVVPLAVAILVFARADLG